MPEESLLRVFLFMRYIRPPDKVVLRDFRGHEGPGTSAARRMTMSSELELVAFSKLNPGAFVDAPPLHADA